MAVSQEVASSRPQEDQGTIAATGGHSQGRMPHPVMMMLFIILAAAALTYLVPSGEYARGPDKLVVPGTFHTVPKAYGLDALLTPHKSGSQQAFPASIPGVALSIPAGMAATANLIFMVMFSGGMFGVLRASGALDAGVSRLVEVARGNAYVLVPILMAVISAGATFLGMISEFLVVIPVMVVLAERLGLAPLFAVAVVTVAAKIGYLASVTNPVALLIAQPIAGVPAFSGMGLRLAVYLAFMALGMLYVMRYLRRVGYRVPAVAPTGGRLSRRHAGVLSLLALAMAVIPYGGLELGWGNRELGAFYIVLAILISAAGGLSGARAAEAFTEGMKSMMLAGILVGLASAVETVLKDGLVLDTIIHAFASVADERSPLLVAQSLTGVEMALDVLIPSTSGKAAVSLPILAPIAQMSGVSGQLTVMAFLFGNGLTNMVTPTSGMLLAYLAAARVSYAAWMRFVLPLWGVLVALSLAIMALAVVF
ncbi:YfcC family protein [Azospirillum sp. B4]|uniref:YfcC family protein n=1 Tax=Azospirillum sp. B4 TaxID=95605 RepID=UPI0006796BF7|nr:YfcC family protein [Azospirillum sp. B4]